MKSLSHTARTLLALFLAIAIPANPQQSATQQLPPQLDDPANLTGERVSPQDPADTLPINHGALALQQLLRKLRTRASFMLIVAHPDDEDGGMLTYLSRGQGARVAMLTLNRGEGGQNLMSADFDDALGLIRTQELLAADRYMAVDQFFGTEVDFGFSKTKEEAFAKWTHERVLYDAVRCVRLYRPLVIASVFIGGPSDGHGQHQVAGEIAQEVFNAAGDPSVFPDQIAAGLQPWQPLKVYARVPFARIDAQGIFDSATGQYTPARFTNYVTGKVTTTTPVANVLIPEGNTDPLLGGLSYLQFAREGLALQKTQNGGNTRLPGPGRADVAYHRYGSHVLGVDGKPQPDGDTDGIDPSVFTGIDTTIEGIATLIPNAPASLRTSLRVMDESIANAERAFDPAHPEACAPSLREALVVLDLLIKDSASITASAAQKASLLHELRIKRVQLNSALVLSLGITLTAQLQHDPSRPDGTVIAGLSNEAELRISAPSQARQIDAEVLEPNGVSHKFALGDFPRIKELTLTSTRLPIPNDAPPTRPYFSRPNTEQPFYDIDQPSLRNAPSTPSPLIGFARFDLNGVSLEIKSGLVTEGTTKPVAIIPEYSIAATPPVSIDPTPQSTKAHVNVSVSIQRFMDAGGTVRLEIPKTWTVTPAEVSILPAAVGTPTTTPFVVSPNTLQDSGQYSITVAAELRGHDYSEGYRPVGYPGLTYTNYYTPATTRIVPVDVTTAPNLNIAYLPGTGDDLPASLEDLGIHAHTLTLADLNQPTLKKYDAVILGVRAYAAHLELAGAGSRALLDYASSGGVVLLQYMTARFGDAEAPFPISVPGDPAHNVVDEAQPVTLLAPADPLLTWPNRITPSDFDHWIEERGHGFAASWAPQFTPLLEVHDPGQPPQQGGLLVAHTGKGLYIYCALALYRQLPEGVPGAYRLLANLISAAKNPTLNSAPTPTAALVSPTATK
jgi:LmbE family N-acetylglucosaminyl deacetylase